MNTATSTDLGLFLFVNINCHHHTFDHFAAHFDIVYLNSCYHHLDSIHPHSYNNYN